MHRGGVPDGALRLPLAISASDGRDGIVTLVGPVPAPENIFPDPVLGPSAIAPKSSGVPALAASPPRRRQVAAEHLPAYSRSLLRIQVPVMVTLAVKRQGVGRILELGPGSIIQFEKSCEENVDLEVGGQKIGIGQAVKVGDKFGIRLTSLVLPEERFRAIGPAKK
jgi:flagellar motor switch/type III secretory pathway protein FliN